MHHSHCARTSEGDCCTARARSSRKANVSDESIFGLITLVTSIPGGSSGVTRWIVWRGSGVTPSGDDPEARLGRSAFREEDILFSRVLRGVRPSSSIDLFLSHFSSRDATVATGAQKNKSTALDHFDGPALRQRSYNDKCTSEDNAQPLQSLCSPATQL